MKVQPYKCNGVTISPTIVQPNENLTITYNGLLAQSGASDVYLHIGCGPDFQDKRDIKMQRLQEDKFEACVKLDSSNQTVNFCFRDPLENWETIQL